MNNITLWSTKPCQGQVSVSLLPCTQKSGIFKGYLNQYDFWRQYWHSLQTLPLNQWKQCTALDPNRSLVLQSPVTSCVWDPEGGGWDNRITRTGSSCFFPSMQVSANPCRGAAQLFRICGVPMAHPASTLIQNFSLRTVICGTHHADMQICRWSWARQTKHDHPIE